MMKRLFLFSLILFLPVAAVAGTMDVLITSLQTSMSGVSLQLTAIATKWLSILMLVQMLITNIGQMKVADFDGFWAKFLGSLAWFSFCWYALTNGPVFIGKVISEFFSIGASITGTSAQSPALIISQGATIAGNLIQHVNSASGITDLFLPSLLAGVLGVFILAVSAYIAFKLFILQVEGMIVVMMAPLSFSFLALNAIKDHGLSPFKSMLSLGYRIILLSVILATMGGVSDNLVKVIDAITSDSLDGIWAILFSAVAAFGLLGFLAHKSDTIASNLANGSSSLGSSDVAAAAAMGMAAGALAGSGVGAASSGAAKAPQAMSSFLSNLMGGGSVSNASPSGTGGRSPVGNAPPMPASASMNYSPPKPTPPQSESSGSPAGNSAGNGTPAAAKSGADSTGSTPSSAATAPPAGNGSSAGVGGAGGGSDLEKNLGKLVESMSQPPKQPTLGDRLGELNQHVAQERSVATSININSNAD